MHKYELQSSTLYPIDGTDGFKLAMCVAASDVGHSIEATTHVTQSQRLKTANAAHSYQITKKSPPNVNSSKRYVRNSVSNNMVYMLCYSYMYETLVILNN